MRVAYLFLRRLENLLQSINDDKPRRFLLMSLIVRGWRGRWLC